EDTRAFSPHWESGDDGAGKGAATALCRYADVCCSFGTSLPGSSADSSWNFYRAHPAVSIIASYRRRCFARPTSRVNPDRDTARPVIVADGGEYATWPLITPTTVSSFPAGPED